MLNFNQKGAAPVLVLVAIIGLVGFLAISSTTSFKQPTLNSIFPKQESKAAGNSFLETFDGTPTVPTPFSQEPDSINWDVTATSRDGWTWNQLQTQAPTDQGSTPVRPHHGPGCEPPLDASNNLVTHPSTGQYADIVFECKDHIMTAIYAEGYGVVYLTPNQMVDFSGGEAVIKWDMTTLRTSARDWVDVWITPMEDSLSYPLPAHSSNIDGVDGVGQPKRAVHVEMGNAGGGAVGEGLFLARVIQNFNDTLLNNWQEYPHFEQSIPAGVSPQRRDIFELHISRTGLKFGMPAYNRWWYANSTFADLGWDKGIVQFGHHSYNAFKCADCKPDTWHWDNVSISPSIPFTMIKSDKRILRASGDGVTFSAPAPVNSYLRFLANATNLQVSFDSGVTWQPAKVQPSSGGDPNHASNYFMTIPTGVNSVKFKGGPVCCDNSAYRVQDISVWSESLPASPTLTPTPGTNPLPGDINTDKIVNILDYNLMITDYGARSGLGLRSDLNHDNVVNILDYNLLITNYNKSIP